ncbi:MAG: hypothetical protein Q8P67_06865 [archaeon]|nr:hypothetical protein [archaeon]
MSQEQDSPLPDRLPADPPLGSQDPAVPPQSLPVDDLSSPVTIPNSESVLPLVEEPILQPPTAVQYPALPVHSSSSVDSSLSVAPSVSVDSSLSLNSSLSPSPASPSPASPSSIQASPVAVYASTSSSSSSSFSASASVAPSLSSLGSSRSNGSGSRLTLLVGSLEELSLSQSNSLALSQSAGGQLRRDTFKLNPSSSSDPTISLASLIDLKYVHSISFFLLLRFYKSLILFPSFLSLRCLALQVMEVEMNMKMKTWIWGCRSCWSPTIGTQA